MIGEAYALGAGTIINAIATGKGAAFGLDLKVWAGVELDGSGVIEGRIEEEPGGDTGLIEACVRLVLKRFDARCGAKVTTRSEVPMARGLSSSSAAANATILAALSALDKKMEALEIVNLGVDAAVEACVTITGAFDDACASFFGGGVITDNAERKILKSFPMEELGVIVYYTEEKAHTAEVDVEKIRKSSQRVEKVFAEVLNGDVYQALTLNGEIYCAALGYSPEPARVAIESGAIAAGLSGTGPAFIALCRNERVDYVKEAMATLGGKIITTRTNNSGAGVL